MKKVLLTATVQSHIAQFHKSLIKMLQENNYEVHVAAKNNLAQKNGLNLVEPDKIFDINFSRNPLSVLNIRAYRDLKKLMGEYSYDIVHCNTPMGGVVTRLAARKFRKNGLKVFYTAHGFHFYKGSPLKNWLLYYPIEKVLSRYTDKLITITMEDYELAKRKFKTSVYHTHGVGVNSEKFFPFCGSKIHDLKCEFGFSDSELIIICIGELNNNKNQIAIINAMIEILKSNKNIILLLAGNGPNEVNLKKRVSSLELDKNIFFLGYQTNMGDYINISDIVVSTSFREGLPLNIIEGMLCKKPIIASYNRGHKELVINNYNGFIIDDISSKNLSNAIIELFNDPEFYCYGKNSLNLAEKFEIKSVIEEYKHIYFEKDVSNK